MPALRAHHRVVGQLEIGRPRNSPKAVEGHRTPKAPSFETHDCTDLECGSPLPLSPPAARAAATIGTFGDGLSREFPQKRWRATALQGRSLQSKIVWLELARELNHGVQGLWPA